MTITKAALKSFQDRASLPGALSVVTIAQDENGEGVEPYELVEQEGYGIWPVCDICVKSKDPVDAQIDPSEWSNHQASHIS